VPRLSRWPLRARPPGSVRRWLGRLAAAGAAWLAFALPVAAHSGTGAEPPRGLLELLAEWSFDPLIQLPLLGFALAWLLAVRRVNRAHPGNAVPRLKVGCFLAGLLAIEVALQSPIERYDTTLFSVHMAQHLLLTLVAAPLLALGSPVTVLLRLARPEQRQRVLLPILHSRALRVLSFPVVAWLIFAGVMWGTHFSPIFQESLESPLVHDIEHLAYLAAGLLFWWPAVAADPGPWRMPHPVRLLYVFLQMPQNTFLALAIYSSSVPLYRHYATLDLDWGPGPVADQQLAGGLMWVGGDLIFLAAVMLIIAAWMRDEERRAAGVDARLGGELEAIHAREHLLAARLARERGGDGPVPGARAAASPTPGAPPAGDDADEPNILPGSTA